MIKVLVIPYESFKARVKIIRKLELEGYKVWYDDRFIYDEKSYRYIVFE